MGYYSNKLTYSVVLVLAAVSAAMAQPPALLDAMSQELNRNFTVMKEKADPAPYFLSYEVTEVQYQTVSGTLGTIEGNEGGKNRELDVSVRAGSPKLDNYHHVRTGGRGGGAVMQSTSSSLTFEDSVNAIKRRLWLETDAAYRAAAERLIRIKTNTQVKVAEEDNSDDFSLEPASVSIEAPPKLKFDKEEWEGRIRKLSARFGNYPSILTSHVTVSGQTDTRFFVNTEGTRLVYGRGFSRVII